MYLSEFLFVVCKQSSRNRRNKEVLFVLLEPCCHNSEKFSCCMLDKSLLQLYFSSCRLMEEHKKVEQKFVCMHAGHKVVSTREALEQARRLKLDLVEVCSSFIVPLTVSIILNSSLFHNLFYHETVFKRLLNYLFKIYFFKHYLAGSKK